MKYKILTSLLIMGLLASAVGWGTFAYFSDTETTTNNTFTAGTLELDGAGFASFDLGSITANMAPGDLTQTVTITINNTGSLPLAWFGGIELSGGTLLREALFVNYAQMEFVKPDGTTSWEPTGTDNFIANGVGAGTYASAFAYLASPPESKFGVISLDAWDNNALMTPGFPYEHMGALKPDYAYRLTLQFGFAPLAGNEYQGDNASPVNMVFKAYATQVNAGALNALNPGLSVHLTWLDQQLAKQA